MLYNMIEIKQNIRLLGRNLLMAESSPSEVTIEARNVTKAYFMHILRIVIPHTIIPLSSFTSLGLEQHSEVARCKLQLSRETQLSSDFLES